MPTLDPTRFDLPLVDGFPDTDSRWLTFSVVQGDGSAKDITNDDVAWYLAAKPYHDREQAVLTDDDAGVTIRRDTVVDPEAGEFRVELAGGALAGEWGCYWQFVDLDPPDDSRQSWRGTVVIEDA